MGEKRPQPVVNRALVTAALQFVVSAAGLAALPIEAQNAVVEVLIIIVIPLLLALATWLQAKLSASKVTPIRSPRVPVYAEVKRYDMLGRSYAESDVPRE